MSIRGAKQKVLNRMAEGFCKHGTDMNCHLCEKESFDRLKLEVEDLRSKQTIKLWKEQAHEIANLKIQLSLAEERLNHLLQANTHLELTACRVELAESEQKIEEYEKALTDIGRGFIDYDQTELCRDGMMITAKEAISKFHKPTMVNE